MLPQVQASEGCTRCCSRRSQPFCPEERSCQERGQSGQKSLRDDGHVVPGVEDRWGMGTVGFVLQKHARGPWGLP